VKYELKGALKYRAKNLPPPPLSDLARGDFSSGNTGTGTIEKTMFPKTDCFHFYVHRNLFENRFLFSITILTHS